VGLTTPSNRFSYIHGSHADIGSMNLDRFDLVTAFCTLYYLSSAVMRQDPFPTWHSAPMSWFCNAIMSAQSNAVIPRPTRRLHFVQNVELVRKHGFPNVTVIERRGSNRPLVIARTR